VTAPSFHPYTERHGPDDAAVARYMDAVREIPRLEPLFVRVADVTDASAYPEIARALEHTRSQQGGRNHGG
jgi:hypothetical protein